MKNWRTTLVGMAGAVVVAIWPMIEGGVIDWQAVRISAFIAAVGFFAKDAGISGTAK